MRALGPSLVPFLKTTAIYFVLAGNIANRPLYAMVKCLPIASLIIFVLLHYRTRLAPKKGDKHAVQLLGIGSIDSGANGKSSEGKLDNSGVGTSAEASGFGNWKAAFYELLRGERSRYSRLVLLGLLLSLIGDVCLVWRELFLAGMVFFALAHGAYAAAFSFTPFNPLGFLLVLVIGLTYHYAMQVYFVGVFAVAAPCYSVLIGTMLWRALSRLTLDADFWQWTSIASCFGASLFAISDGLLGVDRFAGGVPYVRLLVMLTYYSAQLGISVSVVDTYRDPSSDELRSASCANDKRRKCN